MTQAPAAYTREYARLRLEGLKPERDRLAAYEGTEERVAELDAQIAALTAEADG